MPKRMEEYEDNWQTSMGGILFDKGMVSAVLLRGKDIFTELRDKTWVEYLLFAMAMRILNLHV